MISNVPRAWFESWFESPYYPLLYTHRNEDEADMFVRNLVSLLPLAPNASLLDVSCGEGRHSLSFSTYIPKVVGIDLSERHITKALRKANSRTLFVKHDMRKPFAVEAFDMVFNGFTSFGYAAREKDNKAFFSNMCLALQKKGYLIFDYLNTERYAKEKPSKTVHTTEHVRFEIDKHQDKYFFYKDIKVHDLSIDKHFTFREQVRKYDVESIQTYCALNHLSIQHLFGTYALEPFDTNQSPRLILIAQK